MSISHVQQDEPINPVTLLEYSGQRRVPLILQTEIAECGLASLAMVASYHGHKIDMAGIRRLFTANHSGMNLQQIIEVADKLNMASRALQCPLEEIGNLALPCILHWDMNHFVVLTGVSKNKITVNDPGMGKVTFTTEEFSKHFTGIALELTPTSAFKKSDNRKQMRITQLWSKISGFKRTLSSLLALSMLLQVFALTTPYYMQLVIDEVLVSYDESLLVVLAAGFGLLCLISVITSILRSYLILRVSSMMNMQMGVNLLRHLMRLPMTYFETRHVGDIVSRFGSLAAVRERITTGLVETFVDGIMAIAVLVMMLLYSAKLTLVVVAAVALYALLRITLYYPFHRATEESIQASAKEQSNFLENIRGIQTIKLFACEPMRQGIWQNRFAEVINADIRLGKLRISFDAINTLLFGIENVLVIYFAAMFVMDGELTVGMILAFVAYKRQLTERASNFIEQLIEFRMLRLHMDRISDIAMSEQESDRDGVGISDKIKGRIELKDISFAYSDNDPEVISNLSLTIEPGESVAITGSSGCGKTTLVKIMLGLLTPTKGQVLIDGVDIRQAGLVPYRKCVAAVMQDDHLLTGSIVDNICFFDSEPDLNSIYKCAKIASIHEDIIKMPMGYNTMVGDMGSQFSGGQIQRLLLARALYQKPDVLFMDEATSSLDVNNEAVISQQIKELEITRVIIAHRPETLRHSGRVVFMEKGSIS
ncbi:ABC transporter ATP-binding protein [Veronia nyctiphanis]|uniref:ABC transporter ATP-binding protein n=1 Tax=Veronia nyctiphanis TaxID=1278244 RepID=A0A4Q0YSJ4_9GAMM|nr:peptidase domain-containing ABC transporter [Veronia nyctiphanis]RXJ72022.1 ABC transporter ATP-binding protein [Veronia nyctiphanis]RXJ72069.1 ABC transporter ATP-binding protein [Veronia nyctiphanis]